MAYRASNVKRLQQTRPNTAAAPITPSPQSGTQIKAPTVGGLFNAPMNQEGLRTNQMVGNMGDSLFQAGQAAMKKRKQANQLFEITNKSSNFEIGAIDLENEIKSKVVSQERPANKMEEDYKAGLEKLRSGLTKDVKDPIVLAGVNKAIQSYVGKNYGKFAEIAFKAENESGLQTFYKNVRNKLSKQLGNGKADLESFTGIIAGLEEKKNAFVMAGIESSKDMTKNIDAILKDVYQKELLDYSNVKELEGMRNNPKFDWVDKKSIDDRITEIKAIETAQTTADKENFKRDEERFKVLKEDTFSSLALRALSGENISGDRDVLLSFTQDILAAFKNNLITWEQLGTLRNPEKAVPYGREDATEVRKIAMRLLPQFSEGDRELGTLNYDIATAKDPLKKKKLTVQRDAYMETLREQSFQVAKSMVGINKTSKLIPELEKIGIKPNDARQMLQALTVGRPKGQTPLEEGIMLKRKISTAKGVTPEKQNPELTGPGVPSEKVDEIELDHKLNQSDKQATADDGDLDGSRHDLGGDKNALEAQDIKEQKAKMEGVNAQFPEKEGEEIGGETPPATEEQRATIQEVQGQELPDESSAFAIPDDDESGDTLAEEAQTSQVKETRKPITIEELAAQEYPYVPDIAPNWTKDEIEYEKKLDKEAKIEFIKGQLEKSPNAYPEYIITENGKPLNLVQQKDVLPPKDIPNRSYALAKEYSAVDVDTDKLIYNKSVVKGETVGSYVDLIVKAAKSQSARDLVPDFVALMEQESKFNNGAKSWTNVKGLVQMTQGLASDLGLSREDITTPEKVIPAGFKHFKRLLGTFKSKEWTHIGWNAGWGVAEKLKRYGIDPGNWETTKGKLEQALRAFPKTYGPDKIPVKKKLKEVVKHVETIIRRTEEIKKAKAKE